MRTSSACPTALQRQERTQDASRNQSTEEMTRVLVAIACALLLLNRYGVPSEVLGEFLVAAIHVLRPGLGGADQD